jgi:hypothetical protein
MGIETPPVTKQSEPRVAEFVVDPLVDLMMDTIIHEDEHNISKDKLGELAKMSGNAKLSDITSQLDKIENARNGNEYSVDAVKNFLKDHYKRGDFNLDGKSTEMEVAAINLRGSMNTGVKSPDLSR